MPVNPIVLQELIKKYGVDRVRSVKDNIASRREQKMFDRVTEKIATQRLPGEINDEPLVPMEQEIMSYTDAGDPMQMYEAGQMIAQGDILPGVGMMALTLAPNVIAKKAADRVRGAVANKAALDRLDLAARAEAGDRNAVRQFIRENNLVSMRDSRTGEIVYFPRNPDGTLGETMRLRNGRLVTDEARQTASSASLGDGSIYHAPEPVPEVAVEPRPSGLSPAEEAEFDWDAFEGLSNDLGLEPVSTEASAALNSMVDAARGTSPEGIISREDVLSRINDTEDRIRRARASQVDVSPVAGHVSEVTLPPVHSAEQMSTLRARRNMGFYDSDGNAIEIGPGTDFSRLSDTDLQTLSYYDWDDLNAGFRPSDPDYIDTNSIADAINSRRAARRAEHEQYYSDYLRGLDDQAFLNGSDFIPSAVRSGAPSSNPNIGLLYNNPDYFNARDYFRNLSRQEADRRFGTVPNSTVRLNPNIDISSLSQADAGAVLSHISSLRSTYGATPLFRLGFRYEDFEPMRARLQTIATTGVDPYVDWSRRLASGEASGVIDDAERLFGDEWPLRLTDFLDNTGISAPNRAALEVAARAKGSTAVAGRTGERAIRDYFDELSEYYEGKAGYLGSSKAYEPVRKEAMNPLTESYLRGVGDQLNSAYPGLGVDFSEIGTPESLIPIQKAVRENGLVPLSMPLPLDVEHMLFQAAGDPALKRDAAKKAMGFLQEQPSGTANFEFNTSTDSTPMRPRAAAVNYGTSSGQVTVDFPKDGRGNYDYRHVNDMGESLLTFDADGTPVVSGPLRGMIRRYVDSGFTPEAYRFTPDELNALRADPTGATSPEAFARWNKLAEIADNAVLGKMLNAQKILEESMRASGVPGMENFVVPRAQRLYPYSSSFYNTTGIVPFKDIYHPGYYFPKMSIFKHRLGGFLHTYPNGGSIHIAPSKRGTFTAAATKHGKSVQAFASQVLAHKENYSPVMVKKANFARNASKWHEDGGFLRNYFEGGGPEDGSVEKYISDRISEMRTAALENSRTRTDPAVPIVREYIDPKNTASLYNFCSQGYYSDADRNTTGLALYGKDGTVINTKVGVRQTKRAEEDYEKAIKIAKDFQDKANELYAASPYYIDVPGATCIYTATDNYGPSHRVSGNQTFAASPEKYGFVQIPMEDVQPGDIIQYVEYRDGSRVPVHGMIYDGQDSEGNMLFNYSDGGTDSSAIKVGSRYFTYDGDPNIHGNAFRFVGTPADSLKWKQEYMNLNVHSGGGKIRGKRSGKFYVTELNDRREKKFQDWYANAAATLGLDPNPDAYEQAYDYRGYWLNNRDADVSSPDFHFPDTWKQPHHPTFSTDSVYAKGHEGVGHWEGDKFVPGPFNNLMQATEPTVAAGESPVVQSNYVPSDDILKYIKDTEAFRDQWYQDGNGVWTIGYGFTGDDVRRRFPNGMTQAEADQYFADTVSRRIPMFVNATPNFDKLNQNQRDALFSYYYNIGHGGYTRKSPAMQEALRNFDLDTVVSNIDFGYNDRKNRGLRKRRDYERQLFTTPMDYGGILNRLRNVYGNNDEVKAAILRAKNVKKN